MQNITIYITFLLWKFIEAVLVAFVSIDNMDNMDNI